MGFSHYLTRVPTTVIGYLLNNVLKLRKLDFGSANLFEYTLAIARSAVFAPGEMAPFFSNSDLIRTGKRPDFDRRRLQWCGDRTPIGQSCSFLEIVRLSCERT
jgi:hypothetical protein